MYGFRYYFTPLTGVLFTFPSRYWFTIGYRVVFSLGRWSSQIPTGFLGSRGTQEMYKRAVVSFVHGAFTLCGRTFQIGSARDRICNFSKDLQIPPKRPHNPRHATLAGYTQAWFRLFPVRSPLLRESRLISLPEGTEMFQFPSFASAAYVFSYG